MECLCAGTHVPAVSLTVGNGGLIRDFPVHSLYAQFPSDLPSPSGLHGDKKTLCFT